MDEIDFDAPISGRGLTPKQLEVLRRPLNASRVAKRSQGGKQLSYLESWDVRAHLIRVFGYGNFDVTVQDCYHVDTRPYQNVDGKDMVEVIWYAKVRLNIRDQYGGHIAQYIEAAVGNASGPATMLGEHHDNAVKTAASDALKRCAINLGTQFGLSLYDNGRTTDVVKGTLLDAPAEAIIKDEEQAAAIARSLGGEVVSTTPNDEPPVA